jgi:hypothetical protein
MKKSNWIEVSISLPRIGRTVLVLWKDHNGRRSIAIGRRVVREYEKILFLIPDTDNNFSTELDSSQVIAWQQCPSKSLK